MNKIKYDLMNLEQDFIRLKTKVEKYHILFIIIYFFPPLAAAIIYNIYFKEHFNIYVKIIIYGVVLSGILIHYLLRYKFYKSKKRYKAFIEAGLNEVKKNIGPEDDFKISIVESAREIFNDKSIPFSNISIKEHSFWELVFINLGIELSVE